MRAHFEQAARKAQEEARYYAQKIEDEKARQSVHQYYLLVDGSGSMHGSPIDRILTGIDGFAQNNRPARLHAEAAFWGDRTKVSPFDYTTIGQNMAGLRNGLMGGTEVEGLAGFISQKCTEEGKPHFAILTDGDFFDSQGKGTAAIHEALRSNRYATIDVIVYTASYDRNFKSPDLANFVAGLKKEFGNRASLQHIDENCDAAALIRQTVVARRRPVEKSKIPAPKK
jgi:hypothetical protein